MEYAVSARDINSVKNSDTIPLSRAGIGGYDDRTQSDYRKKLQTPAFFLFYHSLNLTKDLKGLYLLADGVFNEAAEKFTTFFQRLS